MSKMTLYCDVDDVLLRLIGPWCDLIQADYPHGVKHEDIRKWEIGEYFPNCPNVFTYLNKVDLYENIPPEDGALQTLQILKGLGHRVCFATSTYVHDNGRKFNWLVSHGFLDGSKASEKDYVEIRYKPDLNGMNACLLDDFLGNLKDYRGYKILMTRPHNDQQDKGFDYRADNWQEVLWAITTRQEKLDKISDYYKGNSTYFQDRDNGPS